MLHWTPARLTPSAVTPVGLFACTPAQATPSTGRSEHARMLAHAAKRRLAARGEDAGYWKACAPAAVAKAAAIRARGGFCRLP